MKMYDPAKERKTFLGRIKEDDGSIWERWCMIHNSEIWLFNPETSEWKLETQDELGNYY